MPSRLSHASQNWASRSWVVSSGAAGSPAQPVSRRAAAVRAVVATARRRRVLQDVSGADVPDIADMAGDRYGTADQWAVNRREPREHRDQRTPLTCVYVASVKRRTLGALIPRSQVRVLPGAP